MATRELNPSNRLAHECTFCGVPETEVVALIHSRGNYICNRCVGDINELLKDEENEHSRKGHAGPAEH